MKWTSERLGKQEEEKRRKEREEQTTNRQTYRQSTATLSHQRVVIYSVRRSGEMKAKHILRRGKEKKEERRGTNDSREEVEDGVTGDREKRERYEGVEGEHCTVVQPRQTPCHHVTIPITLSLHHNV